MNSFSPWLIDGNMIQAIRGPYDVLPGDVAIWHAVESRLRETFQRYGFGEHDYERTTEYP